VALVRDSIFRWRVRIKDQDLRSGDTNQSKWKTAQGKETSFKGLHDIYKGNKEQSVFYS
jgi:hypothetical protein